MRGIWAGGALCAAVIVGGFVFLWDYENRPGEPGRPPALWPASAAALQREPGAPTLVMAVHPHCACSKASVAELGELLSRERGRLKAHLLFLKPAGASEDWSRGELWKAARALPGVEARLDEDGRLAGAFGLATSGHALVYGADGRLAFSGGVTGARGHRGDSAGRQAVAAIARGETPERRSTFVFGCLMTGGKKDGNG